MSSWNWACNQMAEGEKVTSKSLENGCKYIRLNDDNLVASCNGKEKGYVPTKDNFLERDWYFYEEKEWTPEEIAMGKLLYSMCYTYIARDRNGDLTAFKGEPTRRVWSWNVDYDIEDDEINFNPKFFPNVKWEDKLPTVIYDIIGDEL